MLWYAVDTPSLRGCVSKSVKREYGKAELVIDNDSDIFKNLTPHSALHTPHSITVWMSHSDRIERMPDGFIKIAHSDNSPVAAMRSSDSKLFGIQFHPEVVHTAKGIEIFKNFLYNICRCSSSWTMASFVEYSVPPCLWYGACCLPAPPCCHRRRRLPPRVLVHRAI